VIINLISKGAAEVKIPLEAAKVSTTIRNALNIDDVDEEQDLDGENVLLTSIEEKVLHKVVEFCKYYHKEKMTPIENPIRSVEMTDLVQPWYVDFCRLAEREMLQKLLTAANFLDIQPLLELACLAMALLLRGKSKANIRQMFNLTPHVSEEERKEIEEENRMQASALSK